ncbi:hypothetical protein TUM19329_34030 [Legionella antarctica]|uniref:Uncharacterized protein n=1 Tax=Legionella antarctica TaxID=2708020 RepID=A0A6F8TAF3_9GAMM|nr:hypothetical protein [Legionella antarctica]BCA97042.1 hypothetical protein TUM19329_34030 [Legionella antarctica]
MGWFTSDENEKDDTSNADQESEGYGVGAKFSAGARWIWNKAIVGALTYTANTAFQLLEQVQALRTAVPTLVKNPEALKLVRGMADVIVGDVLPLVTLNVINNQVQNYFHDDQEEVTGLGAYSLFLTGLTLVSYTVVAVTWRQGAQASARILLLDSLGPAAFNSNKTILPPTLCTELNCNIQRKAKGMLREPLILWGNDLLTAGISYIPYVGPPVSRVLSIYFIGRYITRLTTPERCERHKAMMQESVLALGLGYEVTTMIMDAFLEATIGMPPFLYYRVMRHLMLLLHVNVAAHMTLPLVLPKDATVSMDPLNIYEQLSRFIADIIFAGLKENVPKYFKPEEGEKPLIPLSTALKFATRVLRSDLESEQPLGSPGFFKRSAHAIKPWVVPPIFHDSHSFVNDKIVAAHWPVIREEVITIVEIMGSVGKINAVATTTAVKDIIKNVLYKSRGETLIQAVALTATWTPDITAKALNYQWGVSETVTLVALKLSKKEDFWALADALKAWFERHNIAFDVELDDRRHVALLGEKRMEPLPKLRESVPLASSQELKSERRTSSRSKLVISPEELVSSKRSSVTAIVRTEELVPKKRSSISPYVTSSPNLFTTRRKSAALPIQHNTTAVLTEEKNVDDYSQSKCQ